ncbi:MAG: TetR/AcrR family transcriptional regulator [Hydrogenophaga sp.]|uniref:acrylate utilization transcriptional regulator AcuR n=1 Tax=Hydrogenophaga sp. TaxID=1904254 RepID=UPI002635DF03|nr:TetR/AcrR family transcriptional regulator [Hydrogenophaga sp.]MDM7944548.1 TetR/AcrR family transcriptional regulator [Hydrogenophaga sp.]
MNITHQTSFVVEKGKRAMRSAARVDTRKDLVWCGTELLTERGFQITGIEEVLKRVGVPKGSFYHYFKSKDDFGHAVIDNYEQYYARKMDRIFGNVDRSPLQRLRDFVLNAKNGMVKFDFKRGCLIGNLGQELAALDTQFRERLESVLLSWERRVSGCLKEAIEVGELAPGQDPEALSRFFWVGWEGAILRAKLMRSLQPIDQFTAIYFDSVLMRPIPTRKVRS